jgi:hypothetical protein
MTYVNPGGEDYEESWWILLILNVQMNVSESEGIFDLRSMFLPTGIQTWFFSYFSDMSDDLRG